MSEVQVRPFRRADREQLTALVNAHIQAVVPGVSVSVNTVMSQLERDPGEFIVDPWVAERATLVAEQRRRVVAAAHLLRYGDGEDVGEAYRGTAEINWLLYWPEANHWPDSAAAAGSLMDACLDRLRRGGWSTGTPTARCPPPACTACPEQWPHVRALYERAGFVHDGHVEIILLARVDELPRPPTPPLEGLRVDRSVGESGTRLSARLGDELVGFIEVETNLAEGGRLAHLGGWADVGNLHVAEAYRRRGVATWLVGQAADWLRLARVERLLEYAWPEEQDLLGLLGRARLPRADPHRPRLAPPLRPRLQPRGGRDPRPPLGRPALALALLELLAGRPVLGDGRGRCPARRPRSRTRRPPPGPWPCPGPARPCRRPRSPDSKGSGSASGSPPGVAAVGSREGSWPPSAARSRSAGARSGALTPSRAARSSSSSRSSGSPPSCSHSDRARAFSGAHPPRCSVAVGASWGTSGGLQGSFSSRASARSSVGAASGPASMSVEPISTSSSAGEAGSVSIGSSSKPSRRPRSTWSSFTTEVAYSSASWPATVALLRRGHRPEQDHVVVAGRDLDALVPDPGRHPQPLADLFEHVSVNGHRVSYLLVEPASIVLRGRGTTTPGTPPGIRPGARAPGGPPPRPGRGRGGGPPRA